jgi:uroporphyrinogen decarboxylase
MLNDEVPLIGFAGSPWTIMCYAVEGKGSKSLIWPRIFFNIQKQHMFYCKITDTTITQREK